MVLTHSGSRPYDVSNDVIKSTILIISNDDISRTGQPINFVFDSSCLLLAASEPHRLAACVYVYKFEATPDTSCRFYHATRVHIRKTNNSCYRCARHSMYVFQTLLFFIETYEQNVLHMMRAS